MKIEVSIIIPVYNAGKYLEHCLQSIRRQTLKEFEVICVDCGSIDESREILKRYEELDEEFHVFFQDGQGINAARNLGIMHAKGNYLLFLNADDFFHEDLLMKAYTRAVCTQADIVVFDAKNFYTQTGRFESGNYLMYEYWESNEVVSSDTIPENILSVTNVETWTKLFRKEFILREKIRYSELTDSTLFFTCIALCVAIKVAYVKDKLIYRRMDKGIEVEKVYRSDVDSFVDEYILTYNELRQRNVYDVVEKAFINMLIRDIAYKLREVKDMQIRDAICERLLSQDLETINILNRPIDFYISYEQITNVQGVLRGYQFARKQRISQDKIDADCIIKNQINEDALVSVIIPVYNVECYVQEMLDSIRKQSLSNIEIICVDDGSQDNSLSILVRNAEDDRRISVYSQVNRGQSVARNNGVDKAKGKYIYFMDSDDVLEITALEILVARMEENQLDVLYFDGSSFSTELSDDAEEVSRFQEYYRRKGSYPRMCSGMEMLRQMVINNEFRVQPCLQIIRKEYLRSKNLFFPVGIIHEDNSFAFKCMANAERAGYCEFVLFNRRIRTGSTMTQKESFDNVYGYFCSYMDILQWVYEHNIDLLYYEVLDTILDNLRNKIKQIYRSLNAVEKEIINVLPYGKRMILKRVCDCE